jgi:DNA polymerase I-like protein with 3'-5' exonuclease and polymerase domains
MKRAFYYDPTKNTIDQSEIDQLKAHGVICVPFDQTAKKSFKQFVLNNKNGVVFDIETPHWEEKIVRGRILLASWCGYNQRGDKIVVTFDHMSIDPKDVYDQEIFDQLIIGHNIKFEEHWLMEHGFHMKHVHCTMLAEQKLLQGSGLFHNLVDVLTRRKIPVPEHMNKDVRKEFGDPNYRHKAYHILYNQDDTGPLHELKNIQDVLIDDFGLGFHLRNIHFPLIRTLVISEREGLVVNEAEFSKLAIQAEEAMKAIENTLNKWLKEHFPGKDFQKINKPVYERIQSLENMITKLYDRITKNGNLVLTYELKNKTHLKAYETAKQVIRNAHEKIEEHAKELDKLREQKSISWTSTDQVISLLEELDCQPLPKTKDKKTQKFKPSLARAARERWLLNNLNHPLKFIIQQYDKYQDQVKHVSSFGLKFLEKYKHPVTGKYHTSYKQGTVETGRLASGDSDAEPPTFNSQQIPALKALRECFGTDPGYKIVTCDLSGAELIVMCSLANDQRLLALSKNDMHSYFANKGWSAIYQYRGNPWTEADVISKTQHSQKRTDYKPMAFGTVYGLKPPKAAETLNCSEVEGAIAIKTIVEEIPDTIKMVEAATAFALQNGYIIHNKRTNSRRWFPAVLYSNKTGQPMEYMDRADVMGASRNTRIQGTQADMLCEAMVTLQKFIDIFKLDAKILLQVHDELVVKFNPAYESWFPQRVADIMTTVANRYLENGVTMKAEFHVKDTWTK